MIVRLAALAAVVAAGVLFALLRDDGKDLYVHDGDPAFNVLYEPDLIEVVPPPEGALLALRGERKDLIATVVVRPLRLPEYEGSVTGLLPVFAEDAARGLSVTTDTRARIHGAPGYEIGYDLPDGEGTLLFLVPDEQAREGVLLRFEQHQPAGRDRGGGRSVSLAMRSALRSLQFGSDRD